MNIKFAKLKCDFEDLFHFRDKTQEMIQERGSCDYEYDQVKIMIDRFRQFMRHFKEFEINNKDINGIFNIVSHDRSDLQEKYIMNHMKNVDLSNLNEMLYTNILRLEVFIVLDSNGNRLSFNTERLFNYFLRDQLELK